MFFFPNLFRFILCGWRVGHSLDAVLSAVSGHRSERGCERPDTTSRKPEQQTARASVAKCHREHVSTTAMTTMRVSTVTMIMGVLIQLLVAGLHGVSTALEIDQWTTMSGASGSMREMKASIAIELTVVIVDGIGIVVVIVFGMLNVEC